MDELRKVSLFENFDDTELDALRKLAREEQYKADQSIFFQGDRSFSMYVLLSGSVKIVQKATDGRERLVSTMGAGQFFGELAMIDCQPRSASVITLEPTRALSIAHLEFRQFMVSHPEALWKVAVVLCGIARQRGLDMLDRDFHDVPYRLLHALVKLTEKHGEKRPDGVRIGIRLTPADLSTVVGSNEKAVKRLLANFRDEDLIRAEGDYIVVPDKYTLERSLEFSEDRDWY